ncbi:MAG: hypothetical protein WCS43_15850 [Verrucomicrobiota bacterium]
MKPSPRDYFAITAAFLAVLLCGYGIGFLAGERTTHQRLAHTDGSSQTQPAWSAATVERLTRQLTLTAAQQTAVANEVRLTATTITTTRHQAMRQYRSALIELHQRLLPHLDANQRKLVEASRKQLQISLDEDTESSSDSNH